MGYYTKYELRIEPLQDDNLTWKKVTIDREELINAIKTYAGSTEYLQCFFYSQSTDTLLASDLKWYEHETDMKKLSEAFPDVLFTLDGQGEDIGDVWRKYFLNGKMQKAELKFGNFNPNKLS